MMPTTKKFLPGPPGVGKSEGIRKFLSKQTRERAINKMCDNIAKGILAGILMLGGFAFLDVVAWVLFHYFNK